MSVDTKGLPSEAGLESQVGDALGSLAGHVEMVRCLLPEFDQVSITVLGNAGGISTCAWVGDVVADLDRLQYGLGEGPCIDSLRAAVPVVAPYIRRDDRWRDYASAAAELGLRSQLAAPLRWREDEPKGALNLYSTTREEVAPEAPLIAEALAAVVATALDSFREIENLHDALVTRKTIGVAIGMLMAHHGLTETAAFALLQRRSSHSNVKLRDIAARMVAEGNASGRELPSRAIC